ncbi:hypothetical protein MNBD_GAMMA20-2208, partial [hydrothermal vent metagenome]
MSIISAASFATSVPLTPMAIGLQ